MSWAPWLSGWLIGFCCGLAAAILIDRGAKRNTKWKG